MMMSGISWTAVGNPPELDNAHACKLPRQSPDLASTNLCQAKMVLIEDNEMRLSDYLLSAFVLAGGETSNDVLLTLRRTVDGVSLGSTTISYDSGVKEVIMLGMPWSEDDFQGKDAQGVEGLVRAILLANLDGYSLSAKQIMLRYDKYTGSLRVESMTELLNPTQQCVDSKPSHAKLVRFDSIVTKSNILVIVFVKNEAPENQVHTIVDFIAVDLSQAQGYMYGNVQRSRDRCQSISVVDIEDKSVAIAVQSKEEVSIYHADFQYICQSGASLQVEKIACILLGSIDSGLGEVRRIKGFCTQSDHESKCVIFAVGCQAKQLDIFCGDQNQALEPGKGMLSLHEDRTFSPSLSGKEAQLPPMWTTTQTQNAVLRARLDTQGNTGVAGQPFDESVVLSSPPPTHLACVTPSNDGSVIEDARFVMTPSSEVLDMSGRFFPSDSPDISLGSPLAGLRILGEETPIRAKAAVQRRLSLPPSGKKAAVQEQRKVKKTSNAAHIVFIRVESATRNGRGNYAGRTLVNAVPLSLRSLDTIDIVQIQTTMNDSIVNEGSCSRLSLSPSVETNGSISQLMFTPSPAKLGSPHQISRNEVLFAVVANDGAAGEFCTTVCDSNGNLASSHSIPSSDLLVSTEDANLSIKSLCGISGSLGVDEPPFQVGCILTKNAALDKPLPPISLSLSEDCFIGYMSLSGQPRFDASRSASQQPTPEAKKNGDTNNFSQILALMADFQTTVCQKLDRLETLIEDNNARIQRIENHLFQQT